MKGRFLAEDPDKIEFTLKITATAKEWTDLRDQLDNKWPSFRLSTMITDLLSKARAVFYEEQGTSL
jgi:hypothetical protein